MDYVYTNPAQPTGGSPTAPVEPPTVHIPNNAGYPPNMTAAPPAADPATQQQYLHQQQLIMQQQQHLAQQRQQQQNQQANSQYAAGQPEANFQRSTDGLPRSAMDRAASAKLRLENFYKGTLAQTIERNQRYVFLYFKALDMFSLNQLDNILIGLVVGESRQKRNYSQNLAAPSVRIDSCFPWAERNRNTYGYVELGLAWTILLPSRLSVKARLVK